MWHRTHHADGGTDVTTVEHSPHGTRGPGAAEAVAASGRSESTVVDVSVLVPVKDEVASLVQLADEVAGALDGRAATDVAGDRWELILVDDGSTDGTWDEILRLSGRDTRIRGLRLRRNFGKSAALAAGFA